MNKKIILFFLVLMCTIFFSGCGSSPRAGSALAGVDPSWTRTGKHIKYPEAFFMTGIGSSSLSLREADDMARQELAKQIKVHLEGEDRVVTSETRKMEGGISQIITWSDVKSGVRVKVDINLEGVSIGERWFDRKTYYSLAVLSRDSASERLNAKIEETRKSALHAFNRGKEREKGFDYYHALRSYMESYVSLKKIQPDLLIRNVVAGNMGFMAGEGEETVSLTEVRSHIDRIVAGLTLKKISGDNQKGRDKHALKEPLKAEVRFAAGEIAKPAKEFPLLFTFNKGRGELEREGFSDAEGLVTSNVWRVESRGSESNSISLSFNTEKILGAFARVLPPDIGENLNSKSLLFSYSIPALYPASLKKPLDKSTGIRELVSQLIHNREKKKESSPLQLVVLDFIEVRSQNRLLWSNILENDIKTSLALLKNGGVEVVDKMNDEVALSAVEKAQALGVPYVLTGGYQLEKRGIKVSARLIDVASNILISAAEVLLKRENAAHIDFAIEGGGDANTHYASAVNTLLGKKPSGRSFHIEIWTDRTEYQMGEKVSFYFRADQDCYLTLIDVGTSGNLTYLFPNQFHQNNFIKGGKTYTIPGPDYGFDIEVKGPPGLERVKAIASSRPLSLSDVDLKNGFFTIKPQNRRRMRDLTVSVKKIPQQGWAEATYEFYIKSPKGVRYRGLKNKPIQKPEKPIDIIGTQGYSQ